MRGAAPGRGNVLFLRPGLSHLHEICGAIRKELGFRTVFNILGPLTNPGTPSQQLLGVYDDYLVEPLAQVLINLGIKGYGGVWAGQVGRDLPEAPTTVCEIRRLVQSPRSSLPRILALTAAKRS